MTTTNERPVIERETLAFDSLTATAGGMRGCAAPYGVSNGRPGAMWQIDAQGFPEVVYYEGTIWEPGVFSEWLAGDGAQRVRFLYQHGDPDWGGSPTGALSLPLGPVNAVDERADGLYVDCSFGTHELAQAVRGLLESGALSEMSICSVMLNAEIRVGDDGKNYRHGIDAELWDVSVVVWGQQGLSATVQELYAGTPGMAERFAGAAISKANAATINAAVDDIRDAAEKLGGHADALSSLTADEAAQDAASGSVESILTPKDANPSPSLPDLAGTDVERARLALIERRIKSGT